MKNECGIIKSQKKIYKIESSSTPSITEFNIHNLLKYLETISPVQRKELFEK